MTSSKGRVVLIDDDRDVTEMLAAVLQRAGFEPQVFNCPTTGFEWIEQHGADLVLTDYVMPGLNGLDLLTQLKGVDPTLPVIVISGEGTIEAAVQAMKRGAYDFIEKPFHPELLVHAAARATEIRQLRRDCETLQSQLQQASQSHGLVFRSNLMGKVVALVKRLAPRDIPVLIEGDTGTGKEVIARMLHAESPRARRPFVPVDCSSLPETLLESELFGHEKGAFTGASQAKRGLFEEVDGGTLFLDEAGNISAAVQSKLLRVLQDRQIRRIGGTDLITVDFRLISASNVPLQQAVAAERFRADLFYRLNGASVALPPLAARTDDIPLLAMHFMQLYCERFKREVHTISPAAMHALLDYHWPGNVRELEHTIMHAVCVTDSDGIDERHLPSQVRTAKSTGVDTQPLPSLPVTADGRLSDAIGTHIRAVLDATGGNKTRAAAVLGITRRALYRQLKKIDSPTRPLPA